MRALIGLLVLGGLFLAAASWQRDHTRALRAQRRAEHGLPSADEPRADEWSLLVLGRPSGAAPLAPPEDLYPTPEPDSGEGPAIDLAPDDYEPDYRYEVQSNDVLGKICQGHYGTAKPSLVEAVARYNRLSSPDAVRAGAVLLLPERRLLDH